VIELSDKDIEENVGLQLSLLEKIEKNNKKKA